MKNKPIVIVAGEPKSIFFEIFFKAVKSKKIQSPLILIASIEILKNQIKKFNFRKKINLIHFKDINKYQFQNKSIYIINVDLVRNRTQVYVKETFEIAFKILNSRLTNKFINGPVNKSKFLNKKFLGITEYISKKFKQDKVAMLIYNKELSVCPITTHLPLKLVSKKLNQKLIKEKVALINNFYIKEMGFKPKLAITGLNPHCESFLKENPFPGDTIFLKQNRKKYDVILGMYHDQVLAPMKTLKEYNAINITLGLPFYRISPDHGPNEKMINKNISTPLSLINAIKFLDNR